MLVIRKFVFFLVAFISGCATLPNNTVQNSYKIKYTDGIQYLKFEANLANKKWPQQDWWYKYNDDQLNNLMTLALKSAPSFSLAKARLELARSKMLKAEAEGGLSINGNVGYTSQYFSRNGLQGSPATEDKVYNTYNLGLSANYNFDIWGGSTKELVKANYSYFKAAKSKLMLAKNRMLIAVSINYFYLQQALSKLAILHQIKLMEQKILNSSEILMHNGLSITKRDIYNTKLQINNTRKAINQLKLTVKTQKEILTALIGNGRKTIAQLNPIKLPILTKHSFPKSISYSLMYRRPDLEAYSWLIEANLSQKQMAKIAFYPTLQINSSVGLKSLSLSSLLKFSSLGYVLNPSLTLPIFNSGKLKANLNIENKKLNETILLYNKSVVDAVKQVSIDLNTLTSLHKRLLLELNTSQLLEYRLQDLESIYKQGLKNQISVLNEKINNKFEKIKLIDIRSQILNTDIKLIEALGGGYKVSNDGD